MMRRLEIKYYPSKGKPGNLMRNDVPDEVVEKLVKYAEKDCSNIKIRYNPEAEIGPENYFEFMLKYGDNYIAFIGDEPIADVNFYITNNLLGETLGELTFLYTRSEWRDLHIGSILFLYAIRQMECIYKVEKIYFTIADYAERPNIPMRRICEKVLGIKINPNEKHPYIIYKTVNSK
jgi:hypothetical protein